MWGRCPPPSQSACCPPPARSDGHGNCPSTLPTMRGTASPGPTLAVLLPVQSIIVHRTSYLHLPSAASVALLACPMPGSRLQRHGSLVLPNKILPAPARENFLTARLPTAVVRFRRPSKTISTQPKLVLSGNHACIVGEEQRLAERMHCHVQGV